MHAFPNVEAFILVGGKSSRMGRDKALLELDGAPLIRRAADLLNPLVARITLVGQPERYANFKMPALLDRWPDAGPLGGIATALDAAKSPWCLILACDMPFVTSEWVTFLIGKINQTQSEASQQIDVIIPETARGLEPLCAVYRASCAPVLAAALDHGVRKVTDALADLNMKRISEGEWRHFSPDGNLFGNLNTWQDYLAAQQRLKS
jgi:molybdopterin-guanine dinucleotide biosynthesis protein A